MPYNGGMTDLALVLPFALPPPELAPDLAEHLKTPALAALLGKASSATRRKDDDSLRHLPHERLLARALGGAGAPAWAGTAMRGYGLDPAAGAWFMVHPAHIEIARSHLLLNDLRHLGLSEAQSRALYDSALPYVTELGLELVYGDAATWFLRADRWADLQTASPDAAAGLDVSFFLPDGEGAAEFRKLQNELQMLWYQHPANAEREAHGQRPVNAIWLWAGGDTARAPIDFAEGPSWLSALATGSGGSTVTPAQAGAHGKQRATQAAMDSRLRGNDGTTASSGNTTVTQAAMDPRLRGDDGATASGANSTVTPAQAGAHGKQQATQAAMDSRLRGNDGATASGANSAVPPAQAGAHGKQQATQITVIDTLSAAALAGDWAVWLSEMDRLEQLWFAPLLEQLRGGQLKRLRLHLTSRDSTLDAEVTALGLRAFWRRPSLDRLIK